MSPNCCDIFIEIYNMSINFFLSIERFSNYFEFSPLFRLSSISYILSLFLKFSRQTQVQMIFSLHLVMDKSIDNLCDVVPGMNVIACRFVVRVIWLWEVRLVNSIGMMFVD
jgi:hypothetical protein